MTTATSLVGLGALLIGGSLAWLWCRGRLATLSALLEERVRERDSASRAATDTANALEAMRGELSTARSERDRATATLEAERAASNEKTALLRAAREELGAQFKILAADVFEERSRKFKEDSSQSLAQILDPLQSALKGFREKVEEVYLNETRERGALGEQLKQLTDLNGTLREETLSLTRALKGDSKAQGDWGELVLERLLENAGLIEGEHYVRQASHMTAEGERVIPDIVVSLPNSRQMVVDSKVTLTAYVEFSDSEDPAVRDAALKAHLESVRRHIKGLSDKNYQTLYGITALDFVVMFMPLEGAFTAAVTSDKALFEYGWQRNVLLVSPSTLLFVVRTIAHVWQQEAQSRNAQKIAERGAALYDKFAAFVADLTKLGEQLGRAQDTYAAARKKLHEGTGNLVRQAEMLRELGVKPTKRLPPKVLSVSGVDQSEDEGSEESDVQDISQLQVPGDPNV